MATKKIIQRNLPLNVKYSLEGITYISVLDGGCTCDNCGKLISNIATVKSDKGTYNIGTDCLETLQQNNDLLNCVDYTNYLFSDKPALQKAKTTRSKILNQQKKNPSFKAKIYILKDGSGFGFSYSIHNEKWGEEPYGFDYTFDINYLKLTKNYLKDLPNIVLN